MLNTPLLTVSYWIQTLPVPLVPWIRNALIVVFAAMAVGGFAIGMLSARAGGNMYLAKGGARAGKLGLTMGILGLILVWLTEMQVYFFGARFWFLVWGAAFLIWLITLLKYVLTVIPKQAADFAEKARIEKYLPHHH